jgi:hypothetical protein
VSRSVLDMISSPPVWFEGLSGVLISEGLITRVQVRAYLWPFCLDVFGRASKNVKTNADTLV